MNRPGRPGRLGRLGRLGCSLYIRLYGGGIEIAVEWICFRHQRQSKTHRNARHKKPSSAVLTLFPQKRLRLIPDRRPPQPWHVRQPIICAVSIVGDIGRVTGRRPTTSNTMTTPLTTAMMMAPMALTMAMRQAPMARRTPPIWSGQQRRARDRRQNGKDAKHTQDTTAPIFVSVLGVVWLLCVVRSRSPCQWLCGFARRCWWQVLKRVKSESTRHSWQPRPLCSPSPRMSSFCKPTRKTCSVPALLLLCMHPAAVALRGISMLLALP